MSVSNTLTTSDARLLDLCGALSPADVVLLAQQFIRSGNWNAACEICKAGEARWGSSSAVSVSWAMAELGAGHPQSAEARLGEVLNREPQNLAALYSTAWLNIERKHFDNALAQLAEVIGLFPDYPGAMSAFASLMMPGPSYRQVLGQLHEILHPLTYLEIGVETGATLRLAQFASRIVGIDPEMGSLVPHNVLQQARLFNCTSDEFFRTESLASVFGTASLDLAFIDGMHRFENVIRDFRNIEQWSSSHTVVLIHDVLPILPIVAERERKTKFWAGDTWKALWCLLERRQDLAIHIIPTAPSGLAVVRNLHAGRAFSDAALSDVVQAYSALPYPETQLGQLPPSLPIVQNSPVGWHQALGLAKSIR